jgi:peptidoglycan/xylan/chitin deacetylase (PgdA/CDA1 family)
MTEAQLRALADAGFEIGFHTLRHDYLPPLDDGRLERALSDGRARVATTAGAQPAVIAYPHGGADARVADAARAAGYRFGFTGAPRGLDPSTDRLLIGRLETFASGGRFAMAVLRALFGHG